MADRYTDTRLSRPEAYDFRHGETDLVEGSLRWRGGTYVLGGILMIMAAACAGLAIFSAARLMNILNVGPDNGVTATTAPAATAVDAIDVGSSVPSPTLYLPTVTADAPPARTLTPSPAPTR